jgi:exopolyphosphatase/guanosine-5'-triphosphate,3'-diphosphate pyrophosphatase
VTIAAIDVGSNALRLAVAEILPDGRPNVVETSREAVRLGHDVFSSGGLEAETIERTVEAMRRFRNVIDGRHAVGHLRAVGTSALREAWNRETLIARVRAETGIVIDPITGEEEARLVASAVATKVELRGRIALLVDIGGGSVEVSLIEDCELVATESFKLGAVRLQQMLESEGPEAFLGLVREYAASARRRIRQEIGRRQVEIGVGTGGSFEALGDLRVALLGKHDPDVLRRRDLDALVERLRAIPVRERIDRLGLRPDRADVVLPAAVVAQSLMQQAGFDTYVVPRVGLKDGVILELAASLGGRAVTPPEDLVRRSALALGERFTYDADHARTVASFARQLFEATRPWHGLDGEDRLLLEVAALLHDIGLFVNPNEHHKHSLYLIEAAPILGLSRGQKRIAANVARYHTKTTPRLRHESYAALPGPDQQRVLRLSALLRLANALDVEHAGSVRRLDVEVQPGLLRLSLAGTGDLLLERWSLRKHAELLEEVYRCRLEVELAAAPGGNA